MSNTVTTVVVDEGSAQIKVTWLDQQTKKIKCFVMPSMVDDEAGTDAIGNVLDGSYVIKGKEYFVSSKLRNPMTTKREDYQTSPENRVLAHEALRQAGFGGKKLHVLSTLPISQFFQGDGRRRDNKLIDAKKDNLMGDIQNINGKPLANIVSCGVAPESISGWFDMSIDEHGDWNDDLADSQAVMVVDIGGTTTDISVIDGEGTPNRKHSCKSGVFDIANELKAKMIETGKAKSLPRAHIDNVLRTNTYRNFNCSDLIKAVSEKIADRILHEMRAFENDAEALDHIVYVGGGAAIIGEYMAEQYGNRQRSHIPTDPDLAIARGLMKYELANQLANAEAEA